MHFPKFKSHSYLLLLFVLMLGSCDSIDLFEKTTPIPKHEWRSNFKPSFQFNISDTSSAYQIYIILRHNDRYRFNNIWVNLYTKGPGDSTQKVQLELPLAEKQKGWLGAAMGDVYEHRITITPPGQPFYFRRAGTYTFTLEQVMREDPLAEVMDVGLRIEKKTP